MANDLHRRLGMLERQAGAGVGGDGNWRAERLARKQPIDYDEVARQLASLMLAHSRPRFDTPRDEIRRSVAAVMGNDRDLHVRLGYPPLSSRELESFIDAETDRVAGADFAEWQAAQRQWNPFAREVSGGAE